MFSITCFIASSHWHESCSWGLLLSSSTPLDRMCMYSTMCLFSFPMRSIPSPSHSAPILFRPHLIPPPSHSAPSHYHINPLIYKSTHHHTRHPSHPQPLQLLVLHPGPIHHHPPIITLNSRKQILEPSTVPSALRYMAMHHVLAVARL
jgi:hypothetical protein